MNQKRRIIDELNNRIPGIDLVEDAPMNEYTSFRAGGTADMLVTAADEDELRSILELITGEDYPHMILGNGTNILVRDGGYKGAIIKLGQGFKEISRKETTLTVGAAMLLSSVAKTAMQEGLGGIEFASGIPGSLGGAVFMNAGAYNGEIKDVLQSVRLIAHDGSSVIEKTEDQMDMGYRKTAIQKTGEIVSQVKLKLYEKNTEDIRAEIAEYTARRNSKQPVTLPSAGSFFKRPEGHFAGKLIEDSGLKGVTVGGAQVSPLHAGFIVNIGGATATDILQLMNIVQARVMDNFGVLLEPEVRIIGEE